MKKYLTIIVILLMVVSLTGCGVSESTNNSSSNNGNTIENQNTDQLSSINDFVNKVKELGINFDKTDMVASYVSAESGIKLTSGNSKLEIYQFDSSSEAYKNAEKNQQLTMEGFGNFSAIVKNGYALIIDDNFPQYNQIKEIFDKLQ